MCPNQDGRGQESTLAATVQAPTLTLPKGGGAIRGIGEKFAVNPANGTASFTIPIFTTPSRSDFYPQLSLSYESGAGNGPFGLGWKLSVPSVTRKTDKGLPQYRDAENSDIFILSDAEDLVPALVQDGESFQADTLAVTGTDGRAYLVKRYRPRVEGLFSRIERWENALTGETHWQSVSKDNVTSVFGLSKSARIADPDEPARIFRWLLEKSYDDKGNSIVYDYKQEDAEQIPSSPEEMNRLRNPTRIVNCYPKNIFYGRKTTEEETPSLFQVVFDYGEHDPLIPTPAEVAKWPCREDPFSDCHACFEVRTYRLCRRVLMFHNFAELASAPRLVRSTDLQYDENPVCTYLRSVTHTGYLWDPTHEQYQPASFPPVEFTYTLPKVDPKIRFIDKDSLENLPVGLDQARYRWVDLDGEGISGILAEQPEAWFYKRNLGDAQFAPSVVVRKLASLADPENSHQELLDLAGDGRKALVQFAEPLAGYAERDPAGDWGPFTAFHSNPNLSWNDPNLKFIDLNGDGFSDLLISEDEVFVCSLSLGKLGFGEFTSVRKPADEEHGPALVFADPTQSIYLADMTGGGLAAIVRIRNGEVCYWPNFGYGRFGPKVTMDHAPVFDHPDNFDQKRIRLADLDGSGTTDIIYLKKDSVVFWFNQAGNSWGDRQVIANFPLTDDLASVNVVDLFGNGTSCLVWSSPLAENAERPFAYIDLMGGQKPHLLAAITNNLGKQTRIKYAASTQFYLADLASGRPWVTRLPFPVQLVQQVSTFDGIAGTHLASIYSFHHGFYDGIEREFRGFGLVEQWDTESFADYAGKGEFPGGPAGLAQELYVPPVHTKTWFHTGAFFGQGRISRHMSHEYYKGDPLAAVVPDTVLPTGLSAEEEREACRALKGKMLRQEIYAEDGSPQSADPYSVVESNCSIRLIQPFCGNPHAVFFTSDREAISYHYERNPADPRVGHQLTLEVDDFGNVTKSASLGYPRRTTTSNSPFPEQLETLCTYSEFDFANLTNDPTFYRVGVPCETRSFEVTGLGKPSANGFYDYGDLQARLPNSPEIPYEETPPPGLQRRLLSKSRSLYFKNDLTGPLPLGQVESLALPYESYSLAFTPGLLANAYGSLIDESMLSDDGKYLKDADYAASGLFPASDDPDLRWIPSGRRLFDPARFYQPVQFTDPWGNSTKVTYDAYALLTTQVTDALNNSTSAAHDYRAMLPYLVADSNGNQLQAAFDALQMVVGTAVMGKVVPAPAEGDLLTGFQAQLDEATILSHIQDPLTNPGGILQLATTRLLYDLSAFYLTKTTDSDGNESGKPVVAYTLTRETHISDLGSGQTEFQHRLLYSDGFGRAIQTKIVAEPGLSPARGADGQLLYGPDGNLVMKDTTPNPRWIGSGRTVYDNKGNPVKKYEPFFSSTPAFEDEKDLVETGVTPILHYDPLGRLIRTDNPNGTFSTVEFDPWQQISADENDTVLQSQWYVDRGSPSGPPPGPSGPPDTRAAWLAAQHGNTPTVAHFDVLGRVFLRIADNGLDATGAPQKYPTRTTLDIQGNPLVVTDPRLNKALIADFDMVKRTLHTKSIDAGERWTLQDVADKPIWAWDSNQNQVQTVYDELHRPTFTYVQRGSAFRILAGRIVYADRPDSNMPTPPEQSNLRGKIYQSYDPAGAVTNPKYDFKGNLLQSARQLTKAPSYRQQMDWTALGASNDVQQIATNAAALLVTTETFAQSTAYDALNRPVTITSPDQSVTVPSYNERRLLKQISVTVGPTNKTQQTVKSISYNEKGQRTACEYGNLAETFYSYDPTTYRLTELKTTRPNGGGPGTDTLQDLSYYYDPVGNIVEIDDGAQQTIFFSNAVVTANLLYWYDPIYRLTQAIGREHLGQAAAGQTLPPPQYDWQDAFRIGLPQPGDGSAVAQYTEQYQYDSVGNITQILHQLPPQYSTFSWTRIYKNDATSNRLLSTTLPGDSVTPPYSAKYQHDLNGNITQMHHLSLMKWSYKDELQATALQVTSGTPETTYYVYDSGGQRVRKVTESSGGVKTKERIYLGGYEIYREYTAGSASPSVERQTLHIMDDARRVGLVETKTVDNSVPSTNLPVSVTRYQFDNHLGTACLELDDSAVPAIISYEEYFPYGNTSYQAVNSAIEVSTKRYRYTGKERDDETGFYYHGARYYASWLGRWTSCDPVQTQEHVGNSLYSYVGNRPITLVDPSGGQEEVSPVSKITPAPQTQNPNAGLIYDPGSGMSFDEWQASLSPEQQFKAQRIGKSMREQGEHPGTERGYLVASGQTLDVPSQPPRAYYGPYERSLDQNPLRLLPFSTAGWHLGEAITGETISGMSVNRGARLLEAGLSLADDYMTIEMLGQVGGLAGRGVRGLGQMLSVNSEMLAWSARHEVYQQITARALQGAVASEIPGLEFTIEQMAWRNWRLSGTQFKRMANQGLDLFFEGAAENASLSAFAEAKSGASLGLLKTLKSGRSLGLQIRQGSQYYIGMNLETYILEGGPNAARAQELISQLRLGNVRSFAGFARSEQLYQLNYEMTTNFATNPQAATLLRR